MYLIKNKEMTSFENYIRQNIIANNRFSITSVSSLSPLKSMVLDRKQYPNIISLIKEGRLEEIIALPYGEQGFEDLDIFKFNDQENREFFVTVYSNDSLESDPQVIDIIPLN